MTTTNIPEITSPFTLLKGEAIGQLAKLPEHSVHACIADGPYGLSDGLDPELLFDAWLSREPYLHPRAGYNGAEWDNSVPGPELWRAVHRVLVPGGFVLAFGATRTVDLTSVALRLAGFDIRDQLSWVYPSGCLRSKSMSREAEEAGDMGLARELASARTTLKPGREPIVVARKPFLDGATTLENYDTHHVGVLHHSALTGEAERFASNVVVVHDPVCTRVRCNCEVASLQDAETATHLYPADTLSDRVIFEKKPGKSERPVAPDGTTHETVKPLGLMRALIAAVTIPGQVVLDPFLGSGTTAEAAVQINRIAIGCEAHPDYWPLIEVRRNRVLVQNH